MINATRHRGAFNRSGSVGVQRRTAMQGGKHMMTPQFYLFFKGDCLEAMTHYAETLLQTFACSIDQCLDNRSGRNRPALVSACRRRGR
jgi:hypothetical protein